MSWEERLERALDVPSMAGANGRGGNGGHPRIGTSSEAGRTALSLRTPLLRSKPTALAPTRAAVHATIAPRKLTAVRPVVGRNAAAALHRAKAIRAFRGLAVTTSTPPPQHVDPVRVEDALLFPDPSTNSVAYLALQPTGIAASAVFEVEDVDGALRTTGGALTVSCSGLPLLAPEDVERHRAEWTAALPGAGARTTEWRFVPLQVRSMRASLTMPAGHLDGDVVPSVTADTVEATFLADLSAAGARILRQAVDEGRLDSVPGVVQLQLTYAVKDTNGRLATRRTDLSAPLHGVVADIGVSTRTVRAEVGVAARLVVRGDPGIERCVVTMTSQAGTDTVTTGPDGGEVTTVLAVEDPGSASVEWTAEVSFASTEWPVVRTGGVLSAGTGWAQILAPWSWSRTVDVMTVLVGEDGVAIDEAAADDIVVGSAELQASYLGRPMEISFRAEHRQLTTLHLPWPPSTDPAELRVSLMVSRDGRQQLASRTLPDDARWVLLSVRPDASVTWSTDGDAASESTRGVPPEASVLRALRGGG